MIIPHGSKAKYWLGILASIFLGMTFIVAGSGKLFGGVVDFQLFIEGLAHYPGILPYEVYAGTLGTWLVIIELLVGILLVVGIFTRCVAGFSLLLIAGFITNNILLIQQGLGGEPCNCFGMGQELTVVGSLYLDGVMAALAVWALVFYPSRFFQVRPWYWGK